MVASNWIRAVTGTHATDAPWVVGACLPVTRAQLAGSARAPRATAARRGWLTACRLGFALALTVLATAHVDAQSGAAVAVSAQASSTSSQASSTAPPLAAAGPTRVPATGGIWISTAEILTLPTEGPAWEEVWDTAHESPGVPNLSDQDQDNNVITLAKALVCTRLADAAMCDEVRATIMAAMGTENGGRTLALGRELLAYIIAADLVGLSAANDALFRAWLAAVLHEELDGMTLVETHERRPNNWGTHAGATRIAAAIYLGDTTDLARSVDIFKGWLGDQSAYSDFSFGDLDWQADPSNPLAINAPNTFIQGHNVDGVLPDEQRRAGGFVWPPQKEGYVWEGLQGALAQALMLSRQGYDVWEWSDRALLRALTWLHHQADFPAEGDDTWLPHIVNFFYGSTFLAPIPSRPGKNAGFTDWTHDAIRTPTTATSIESTAPNPSLAGQPITVTFEVIPAGLGTPTGPVTVSDGVDSCVGTVAAGSCQLTLTTLGTRTLVATYTGDGTFTGSESTGVPHEVLSATTTTITADTPDPSLTTQIVTVSFTVTGTGGVPAGSVTVSDGVDSCVGTVAAGSCQLTLTTLGARTLVATYAGGGLFMASTSAGVPHQVTTASTTTVITSDTPDPSATGVAVAVTYSVTVNPPGVGVPTGTVTVSDGVTSCVGSVAAGSCILTLPTAGPAILTATYSGDANFDGSTSVGEPHDVQVPNTTTAIVADTPDPSLSGEAFTVSFTVTPAGGGVPTGTVTVSDGVESCVGTVAAGSCQLALTTLGSRTLVATYSGSGDGLFTGSASAGVAHVVQATTTTVISTKTPDPSLTTGVVTVTYDVTPQVGGPATGTVTVSDGVDSCVGTVAAGSCQLTLTTLGARTVVATYAGDGTFLGSVSAGVAHLVQAASVTTLTVHTPDPSLSGDPVTIGYTVTGDGAPTGSVTVTDGVDTCTGTVAAGACTLTLTTPGARTLVAHYSGDGIFISGASTGVAHLVQTGTTTTLTADTPDPSLNVQAVTVSYAVVAGAGTPTGTVTVSDGVDSCVGTVAAGSCQLVVTTLGTRTLVATYGGTVGYLPSVSPGRAHVVELGSTTTTITGHSPDPSAHGGLLTVSFVVGAAGGFAPGGSVTVTDGVDSCVGTVAVGLCQLTLTTLGARTLTATYAGDASFDGSVSSGVPHHVRTATVTTITAHTPDPSLDTESVTVEFSVSADGGTPVGNVTVSDGVQSCVGTVAAGTCQLTLTTLGTRTLVATYAGDGTFVGSSASALHVVEPAVPPTLAVDQSRLTFGGINPGGVGVLRALSVVTRAQVIAISKAGTGPLNWTVTPSHPWLQVSRRAGTGSGSVVVSVVNDGTLPSFGSTPGHVTISSRDGWRIAGEASPPITVPVTINTFPPGASGAPFGAIDTPIDGATGLAGSVGFTGWVLDDVEVTAVRIWRDPVAPEPPGGIVFVGTAVLIDGARPDVATANPGFPLASHSGWGFLVLTNLLPNQGNGTFTFHVTADDAEGHSVLLGSRTITSDNANAAKPFGAIDTPGPGEAVGGNEYPNFGWALTPLPGAIPTDGSTITVFIDGVAHGHPSYGHYRPDLASLFPGLANSNGAVGVRAIDTTVLADGVHTIAWGLVDDLGRAEGIGSRFFTVSNSGAAAAGGGGLSAPVSHRTARVDPARATASAAAIRVRQGYDDAAPLVTVAPGADGVFALGIEMLGRLVIELEQGGGEATYTGSLLVAGQQRGLPIGSTLDAATGRFTWQPGVGFFGTYQFLFAHVGAAGTTLIPVAITLRPQHADQRTARMWVDEPQPGRARLPFAVSGWAVDLGALAGTGVDAVHVWAFPTPGSGDAPVFLGVAGLGGQRPDVAELFGAQFEAAGFGLTVNDLPPGTYDLVAYVHSAVSGTFDNAHTVRVIIE